MLNLIDRDKVERDKVQAIIDSGLLGKLLAADPSLIDRDAFYAALSSGMGVSKPFRLTIIPIVFKQDYNRPLVYARDAMKLNGFVDERVTDTWFRPEPRNADREFVLVCFGSIIKDHPDPRRSELLRELDKLNLEPEGAMELCLVGTDKRTRDLQREFLIVARRQIWQDQDGESFCPCLGQNDGKRDLRLVPAHTNYHGQCRFLCSRK